MDITRYHSQSPWEQSNQYCRVLKKGPHVFVSGTIAIGDEGKVVHVGNTFQQLLRCFEIIEAALAKVGKKKMDIVRTRVYLSENADWHDAGRAHFTLFEGHAPVSTMIKIHSFIDPDALVEVEVEVV